MTCFAEVFSGSLRDTRVAKPTILRKNLTSRHPIASLQQFCFWLNTFAKLVFLSYSSSFLFRIGFPVVEAGFELLSSCLTYLPSSGIRDMHFHTFNHFLKVKFFGILPSFVCNSTYKIVFYRIPGKPSSSCVRPQWKLFTFHIIKYSVTLCPLLFKLIECLACMCTLCVRCPKRSEGADRSPRVGITDSC